MTTADGSATATPRGQAARAPVSSEAEIERYIEELEARAASKGRAATEEILSAFHEESALGKAYDTRLMLRLWPFLRPYRWMLAISLGAILISAGFSLLRPLVMRDTLDHLGDDPSALLRGGLTLTGLVFLEQVLAFAQLWATQVAGARAMSDLRGEVFRFLHSLRLGFFDTQPVGRLVTRVTNDIDAILELFSSGALNAFGDLVRLVGIVAMMLSLDWRLSLFAFAAGPPVALLVTWVRGRSRDSFRQIRAKTARMNSTMNEQVTGMAIVQAYGREAAAAREFDAINVAYRDANIASIKYEAIQDAAIDMINAVCLALVVMSLGWHGATFGTLVAFNAYIVLFFEPISTLAQRYTLLQSAMAGAERVFGLLDTRAEDAPQSAGLRAPANDDGAAFAFDHVDFSYKPGIPVLRDVSFSARPGEKIALVGPTGAGKSTIASLLLRLYEVSGGSVRVGGSDVRGLARDALRRRFAVVPQDVFLFPGSVAHNVAAGEVPDRARVREALERLGALELFERRPEGIDAKVEEHGANFSAGERQLIAFARALYRDAPNLILDEATASVDSDTEARLQRALAELMKGRTALIIAHRLSTIRSADRIVVFHKGRIVEQGTHDELVLQAGLYAKLYELQFSRRAAA